MRADVEGSTSSDSTSKKQSSVDTAEAVVDKTELELIREAAELQLLQASSLRGDQDKVSQQNDTHCEAVPSVGAGQGSLRESESVSAAADLLETLSNATDERRPILIDASQLERILDAAAERGKLAALAAIAADDGSVCIQSDVSSRVLLKKQFNCALEYFDNIRDCCCTI